MMGGHLMVKIVALIVILISMYLPISKKGYSAVELVCKIMIAIVVYLRIHLWYHAVPTDRRICVQHRSVECC